MCTTSIGNEAKRLNFGDLLLLSNGEEATGGRDRQYILANTFESVLGALYLEKGLDECTKFVKRELLYKIDDVVKNNKYKDPKSTFQEKAQETHGLTPVYEVSKSWGPDHDKIFRVVVSLGKDQWGVGEGASKQKAEQEAAKEALKKLEDTK